MTNRETQRMAEQRAALIMEQVAGAPTPVAMVPLSDYPTPEDFHTILGRDPGWTWQEFRQVNRAVQRILKRAGLNVSFVPLVAGDYFPWLLRHALNNTPTARAQYVASYSGPWPEPTPIPDPLDQN